VVALHDVSARYVRLQLRDSTWLHLDEVQVFGTADPTVNLALHKPATQSSLSSWSRKRVLTTPLEPLINDQGCGDRAIRQLLTPCGASAESLVAQLNQLVRERVPLDHESWVALYGDARQLARRWGVVRAQWQHVRLPSLRLAIRDLMETFGTRYPAGQRCLQQLDALEPLFPDTAAGLNRGDAEALRCAENVLQLQQDALLSNPLLAFGRLLLVNRPESTPTWTITTPVTCPAAAFCSGRRPRTSAYRVCSAVRTSRICM
jgi:hypothetical protein